MPRTRIATKTSLTRIDVTVATLNSGRTIERCLKAIRSNLPVRKLVIVDGGSTDSTLNVARNYGAKIVRVQGTLGWSRFLQAENCETPWVVYVDSDVYVYATWWKNVSPYMNDPEIGMVLGFADAPIEKFPLYYEYIKYRAETEGAVGFTNTLIRRSLVLECKNILRITDVGEDDVIARHMRLRSFKTLTLLNRLCYHDKDPYQTHWKAYYRSGQSVAFRYELAYGFRITLNALRSSMKGWWRFSVENRIFSLRLLLFVIQLWVRYEIGFIVQAARQGIRQ